jgi:hypothetical protein
MTPPESLRLIVDFNYSGEEDGVVTVFIGSKQCDRSKLIDHGAEAIQRCQRQARRGAEGAPR